MKKVALIIAVLMMVSLFLTACGGKTELTTVVEDEGAPAEPAVEEKVELPPAPEAPEEEPVVEEEPAVEVIEPEEEEDDMGAITGEAVADTGCMDPSIQALVDKAKDVDELHYLMRETPYLRKESEVFVKDEKMKIVLPEPPAFIRGEYYNAVYLDTDTKEAIAYCEDRKRCDDYNEPFDVEYDDYYRLTPMDWAMTLGCAENIGTETMYNRDVIVAEYEKDGKTNRMWLYNYYGVTSQIIEDVEAKEPAAQRTFEVLSKSVTDEDVVHQYME
ncbi:hypothetical protein KY336_01450 [Candidatus Woesearchaeota archaeon]|nr:hypothetical protein [Candidatus Woesearchaeota archaeon]